MGPQQISPAMLCRWPAQGVIIARSVTLSDGRGSGAQRADLSERGSGCLKPYSQPGP
jgi:hypothetical protein